MEALTTEMIWVLCILAFTIYLFVSEIVRVDVAAILVMVLLGLTTVISDSIVPSLVDANNLFDGFASNAVISIIAVMIIGAGLDKTGLMSKVASFIMRVGGTTEKRVIPMVSGSVGFISSFMQNVGAAALFIPVVSRICARTGLPMSRLLMPMGFTAILGGTMTMIGSSPLILLNDLILTSNQSLPEGMKMETFNLFDVTPIGLALVATGIIYFVIAGRFVLPVNQSESRNTSTLNYFADTYGLEGDIFEIPIPHDHRFVGSLIESFESTLPHTVSTIAMRSGDQTRIAPSRDVEIPAGATIALMGPLRDIRTFAESYDLDVAGELSNFSEVLSHGVSGISEMVVPPSSKVIGKSLNELRMRNSYGMNVLAIHRGGETIRTGLRDVVLQSGDTIVQHSKWQDLASLNKRKDEFLVITQDYPHEEMRPKKVPYALGFFVLALAMILFTDVRLSVALLTGAMGMILTRVLSIDEAYNAVSWKTVFLLASLIPLGAAVELTGTAEWIAKSTLYILGGDVSPFMLQAVIAILATFFTLVMSNVGATVLLVPLAVNIAVQAQAVGIDANPAVFALTMAIATSNSFLIPTHQVNALIMGPGGYSVKDFMRAGGIMTVLFLIVMMIMLNLVF